MILGSFLLAALSDVPMHFVGLVQHPSIARADEDIFENVSGEHVFQIVVHSTLPPYMFHILGDEENRIERIDVYVRSSAAPIQSLDLGDTRDMEPPYRGATYFQSQDINFDGYTDVKLLTAWGVTGNEAYRFWLFDKRKHRFVHSSEFSNLLDPVVVNARRMELSVHSVGGMAGKVYTDQTYRVRGGIPVLVREEKQAWDSEARKLVRFVSVRRGGKMVVVESRVIQQQAR